jgi:anti-sigma factor RsiW
VSQPITHSRAFELLPWLVNGSLGADERDAVEQHVRSCLSCHRELKEQQRLRTALRAQPVVHISPQTGFEKLARSLEGEPVLSERSATARPLDAFLRFAAVAAAGLLVVGGLLWLAPARYDTRGDAAYETLASGRQATRGELDVVFVQSITAAQIQSLLEEIDGSIAAGPTEAGRYRVRLHDASRTDAQLDALVAQLAQDPRVRFAARALSAETDP